MEQKPKKEKNDEKENKNSIDEILKKNEYFINLQKLTEEEIEKLKKKSKQKRTK